MILFISIVVLLLSVFILYNNFSKNKNSLYLCCSLIFMSISALLHHYTVISPNRFWIAILVGHTIPLAFLTGPFLFFYVRSSLRVSSQMSKIDYIHFLPFVISLISIFPYYFTDFDTKLKIAQLLIEKPFYIIKINFSWLYPSFINILLRPFFVFGYSIWSFILLYRYNKKNKKMQLNKEQENITFNWLIVFNSIMVLISLGYTYLTLHFYNSLQTAKKLNEINSSIFGYILVMLFCLIPIFILIFPEILYGLHKIKKVKKSQWIGYKENHESLEETSVLILEFVKIEENLINPNFMINDICLALSIKSQDVMYCFNAILKTKFTTLKKELRVEIAKKEIMNGKLLSHSMEGVWIKSGFSSKTSFFVSFKEVTGMTPLEYLKSLDH